jgi:hypothetical protein
MYVISGGAGPFLIARLDGKRHVRFIPESATYCSTTAKSALCQKSAIHLTKRPTAGEFQKTAPILRKTATNETDPSIDDPVVV